MKLTEHQLDAVKSVDGNILIHAGGGAGKTAAFTARIANLIANEGVSPEEILGLTFTKEAAENMRKRLKKLIGKKKSDKVHLSTFHSFAYGLLKQNFPHRYEDKTIIKDWFKMSKLYDIVAKPNRSNNIGLSLPIKAGELGSFISYQKANMIKQGMNVLIDDNVSYVSYVDPALLQSAFDTYCEATKNARVLEFDDMLVDVYYELKNNEEFLNNIKSRYKYVMVDEFQDTNTVNMEILKLITDNNLFVVGDFRQGIYGFINANINNILDFKNTFSDVKLVELQENFRSTNNIVGFANKVISTSPVDKYKQFSEQIGARKIEGNPIRIKLYEGEYNEAMDICDEIIDLVDNQDKSYNDFAILSRTNTQLGFYESMLADNDIPADVSSSRSFFDRKEISDILYYAEHVVNPEDDMSLRRIINSPSRYISKAIISDLDKYSYKNNITLEAALSRMEVSNALVKKNLLSLQELFEQLRKNSDSMTAGKFLRHIYKHTRYEQHLQKTAKTSSELIMKTEAVEKLFELSKKFPNIRAFLGHVSIIRSNNNSGSKDGVKLMTVHAAKGLEFEHVYIPYATADNFPHEMNSDIEEERRLFYVATSRAKNEMTISAPMFTKTAPLNLSPFLVDVVGSEILDLRKSIIRGEKKEAEMQFRA